MPHGIFSEQVVEEQHTRFRRFYDRYRVSCTDHVTYPDRPFECVLHYNSTHTKHNLPNNAADSTVILSYRVHGGTKERIYCP